MKEGFGHEGLANMLRHPCAPKPIRGRESAVRGSCKGEGTLSC